MKFQNTQILIIIFPFLIKGGEDQVDMGSRITEAIVKLGKHTRRVKILANQGKGFLKSVKMTVIDTYRDVLLPDKKDKEEILVPDSAENDTEIASLMKSLFLQVYDSNYKEFIDVTDSEVLPRRAEIKVEILTYQPVSNFRLISGNILLMFMPEFSIFKFCLIGSQDYSPRQCMSCCKTLGHFRLWLNCSPMFHSLFLPQ